MIWSDIGEHFAVVLQFSIEMVSVGLEFCAKVFAGVTDDAVHIDGFADTFKTKGDEDANRDDDDVDEKVFEGISGAFGAVNFHRRSLAGRGQDTLAAVIRG
jgi:hypothetical protein